MYLLCSVKCVKLSLLSLLLSYQYIFSDLLFKMLIIGDSSVGKSCLLIRYAVSVVLF